MPIEALVDKNGFRYRRAERIPWVETGAARVANIGTLCLSQNSRSKAIQVDEKNPWSAYCGKTGYRSIMASEGAHTGDLYFEVTWTGSEESNIRFGIARIGTNPLGPVGYDQYGYGWCSDGNKFHHGKKQIFSEGFDKGDILGCRIRLSNLSANESVKVQDPTARLLVQFHGMYIQEKIPNESQIPTNNTTMLVDSFIEFYKNGISVGVAFEKLPFGIYYPCLSLYRDANINVNFGPDFVYPPQSSETRPFSSIITQNVILDGLSDMKQMLTSSIKVNSN